jgi:hypothetical protein
MRWRVAPIQSQDRLKARRDKKFRSLVPVAFISP